jgi:hypothetical protein
MRQLIGKIYYDTRKEEGVFKMDKGFFSSDVIIQADILTDISWQAENMKDDALSKVQPLVAACCGYEEA